MIDVETHKPVRVSTDGDAGPYLMVPLEQLADVRRALREHEIVHFVAEDAIELDGRPVIAIIDFARNADANLIQSALDAA